MSELDNYLKGAEEIKQPKTEERKKEQKTPGKDEEITEQDRKNILLTYMKKNRMSRKEKKMVKTEYEGLRSKQWVLAGLALGGAFFIFMVYQMTNDMILLPLIIMLGAMMFLPAGMILGWAMLDPYVRCKILRRMSKKNYGIVQFVGKGNKMVSKIKNFDDALIWKKNNVWVITREHIYQLTKNADAIVEKNVIEPENIVSLIETVPMMFVDLDSMQPLSLARDRREGINPLELGATLKAWVDNQLAKAMFLKKTMDMYMLIILIVSVISVGLAYINMNKLDELATQLKLISSQLANVTANLPN